MAGDKPPDLMDLPRNPALGGTWVRRAGAEPNPHICEAPAGEQLGDLWRCGCGRLLRWADACDWCDSGGHGDPLRGMCTTGRVWRPATYWQRIRHWDPS